MAQGWLLDGTQQLPDGGEGRGGKGTLLTGRPVREREREERKSKSERVRER